MKSVVTAEQMRRLDAEEIRSRTPSKELMLRAGRAVFFAHDFKGKTAIVCGKGNNAGDGYVLASLLKKAGKDCTVYTVGDGFSEDGRYYFDQCVREGVRTEPFHKRTVFIGFDNVVDCVFGTGFRGEPEEPYRSAIERINQSGAYVISVDINSGLNGTGGRGNTAVKSDLTISIGTLKTGHFLNRAKDLIGRLQNADIGIKKENINIFVAEDTDFSDYVKNRKNDSNKSDYGFVGIMGGCIEYSGAIKLASLACAAMRAGCGVCRVLTEESVASLVAAVSFENTVFPLTVPYDEDRLKEGLSKLRAIAVGMGWGRSREHEKILEYILRRFTGSVVIDADGLNVLCGRLDLLSGTSARVIVTPHLGEMARLTGKSIEEIKDDPIAAATDFSLRHGVITLLKGPTTVVTDGVKTILTPTGCGGMATAGSGDVLSGVLVGVLGQGFPDLLLSVAYAAYLAGLAGEFAQKRYGDISMTSKDTVTFLPDAVIYLKERCGVVR